MQLDLRKDFTDVYSYLANLIRSFDPATHQGLGGPGKVKLIECGFECVQDGWVAIVFDTRPDAQPDGEWTSYAEGNELKMPRWAEVSEANSEEPITLVLLDGTESELPPESEFELPIGEMLKAVLLKARTDGLFALLPKVDGCELGVEGFYGEYGWPAYEERGKENLA